MKANVSSTIKAYLVRGALYLLLLLAVCVVPFALAQRTANKQSLAANATELATTSSDSDRDAGALPMPGFPTGGAIYNQYDNPATKPPLGIGSQKFEPAMAAFDDQAADDFVITAPPPPIFLYTTGVRVMGEYSEGGGPASSFNVYIYANGAGNLPGAGIASFLNLPYTGTPPDFVIHWSPFSLPSGTYWVSVQAVQNFNTNGQWFWHNRTVQSNSGAAWQNPGNGYGTDCITWNRKNACMSDQVWPDQVFQILGFVEGPTPTATPTATHAPSSTPTATFPPSPTPTATLTPTSTPTVSPIPTPSDPGGTPTATPTATCCQYIPTTGTGTIEPGTTDIGNHCDNCTTTIPLPFTVRLYGQIPAQVASVSSNGNLQYVNQLPYAGASCPLPDLNLGTAILPYQDDLRTDQVADCSVFGSGCGVFTSVTGTAPNRAFNIEWRAAYSGRSGTANFEVRFYENQNSFDIFYGATADNGGSEESGVQAGVSLGCPATTFSCHTPTLTNGLKVTYSCGAPVTPTPTATATAPPPSPTTTTTITPTITPPSPSPSPTIFDTPTPTPTLARVSPTPRPRPSPTSRP